MKSVDASQLLGWINFNRCYDDREFLYLAQMGKTTLKNYIKLYWVDMSETEYKRLKTACEWFYKHRILPQWRVEIKNE